MTGKELLKRLSSFNEDALQKPVYICEKDFTTSPLFNIRVLDKKLSDFNGFKIPINSILIN